MWLKHGIVLLLSARLLCFNQNMALAFNTIRNAGSTTVGCCSSNYRQTSSSLILNSNTGGKDGTETTSETNTNNLLEEERVRSELSTTDIILGRIDEQRIVFPELNSGEVPRMFSTLEYIEEDDGMIKAKHNSGSILGSAALVAGTAIGAGILALPSATAAAGFIPSSIGLSIAWVYMTMSGLFIAELSLNRLGETGRPGIGLLDLYKSILGNNWLSLLGSVAYFFLHYAIMIAYFSQGGTNISNILLPGSNGFGQTIFASVMCLVLYNAKSLTMERLNNALVLAVFTSFLGILIFGIRTADLGALIAPENQHLNEVWTAFPILFLSMVYQNIVPTVVEQLEGDRKKITTAIVGGTSLPFLMLLAWNGVILGNVVGKLGNGIEGMPTDPVALLQQASGGSEAALLGTLVSSFSELAIITSVIGMVYGLLDAWTDVLNLPNEGPTYEKWKPALFAAIFLPPLLFSSLGGADVFYKALDYGGAFGISTLFLVLPPIMIWKVRYNDTTAPLTMKPLVPFGKISLSAMLLASSALILQQTYEKTIGTI